MKVISQFKEGTQLYHGSGGSPLLNGLQLIFVHLNLFTFDDVTQKINTLLSKSAFLFLNIQLVYRSLLKINQRWTWYSSRLELKTTMSSR